jgi:hypothetical protein
VDSYGVSPAEILTVVSLPCALVLTVMLAWRRRAEGAVVKVASTSETGRRGLDGRVSLDSR